uniref:Uncharacterized protein n=1 Tax=Anguilla anguilla TaxID=7936 RepID=A0A0E9T0I9_ANGAN
MACSSRPAELDNKPLSVSHTRPLSLAWLGRWELQITQAIKGQRPRSSPSTGLVNTEPLFRLCLFKIEPITLEICSLS